MKTIGFGGVVFALAILMYAGTLHHFFVSDDFLNLERNGFRTVGEGLSLFSTTDTDFYRPIPRLHFGILQGIASDRVEIWNAVGLLLHGMASFLAFALARDLLGRDRESAARWAGVLFAVHFIHVEPVVWASGVTTTWVTLFLLAALLLHRRSRRTGRARDLALSVAAFGGALLSKETAVAFVPLWLVTLWVWPGHDGRRRTFPRHPTVAEAVPYAVLLGAYVLVVAGIDRGGDASPYRWVPGAHLVKNALFFAFGGFLPIRYWELQQLWAQSAGLSAFVSAGLGRADLMLPLVTGGLGLLLLVVRGDRDVRGGLAWIAAASLPFLLLPGSGERFQYLSSFGACLALGASLARIGRARTRFLVGALVVLVFVAGNLDRQRDWRHASRWTRAIVSRWDYLKGRRSDERIEFVGIPDAYRSAWVFRNGFGSMVRLYWERRPYWREENRAAGAEPDLRMLVELSPGGALAMFPEDPSESPPSRSGSGNPNGSPDPGGA